MAADPLATPGVVPAADGAHRCCDLSQIAAQRGAYKDMRADSTSRPTDGPTIVGLRSGTLLDPELVAELRAVAGRTDIAQRVLTILELSQDRRRQSQPVDADTEGAVHPTPNLGAPDSLECARWYGSSEASQRCGDYLSNELADNTTSKFLK